MGSAMMSRELGMNFRVRDKDINRRPVTGSYRGPQGSVVTADKYKMVAGQTYRKGILLFQISCSYNALKRRRGTETARRITRLDSISTTDGLATARTWTPHVDVDAAIALRRSMKLGVHSECLEHLQ
jgi:hypothetical protein